MPVQESTTIQENPTLSQTDINAGYEFREYNDKGGIQQYIISDGVNRRLRMAGIKLAVKKAPYEIPERFRKYSEIMLEHQLGSADPGQFENHRICGMFSDLNPHSEIATIGYAEYYDMLATFYSFPFQYRNDNGAIEFRGASYIYNDFGVVYPLSMSLGANPIGANTLAITSDYKMLIVKQDDGAHVNPGKLMPSGSGSASWHDYIDIDAETLQDIVKHGAEYKLRNECNIPESCSLSTHILGMARVPIGMKPDFYCFTMLDMTWDELKAAGATPFEVVEARDNEHLSDALIAYIEKKNAESPSSVSIQLYLETQFLAEVCR